MRTNGELAVRHGQGAGLIFNDFTSGPSGARYNVLHLASCPWVSRMLTGADPGKLPSVRKIFFANVDEALSWLERERGIEGQGWKRCATCFADQLSADLVDEVAGIPDAVAEQVTSAPARLALNARSGPLPVRFAMPSSHPIALPVLPRLASWNKSTDSDQVRLHHYLDMAEELLRPRYEHLTAPLALRLDVGLQSQVDLLHQRDLDNYLLPLATRLGRSTPGPLVSIWGTKQHAASSWIRIEPAVPVDAVDLADCHALRVRESYVSAAFKKRISDQLGDVRPLPPGPVRVQLSFAVGNRLNWLNLWKPTIDALGKILGHPPDADPWNPLDGRITELGLHCRIDPDLGNDKIIFIAANSAAA